MTSSIPGWGEPPKTDLEGAILKIAEMIGVSERAILLDVLHYEQTHPHKDPHNDAIYIDSDEKFHVIKNSYKEHSFAELIDIYPDAIPAARKAAKARIKELKYHISSLSEYREEWSNCINKKHFKLQPGWVKRLDEKVKEWQDLYEKEKRKSEYQLEYLDNYGKPKEDNKDDITPERVARAKQFPIPDLLEVKRGTTLCLWHDDHRPSMKVYPDNHVYCFSCSKSADAIDICMALNGIGFREAVRKLAP